ncbi:MAG: protein translocase subunit SecD [Patescibacteria group bacterium]
MFKKNWLKLILILVAVGILTLADLSPEKKEFLNKIPIVGEKLAGLKVNLGLDLQGGTHLDYRVVTKDVPENDIPKIVAGVKEVIERRVNNLGVAEPNIFDSRVGDEYHIIVELAGIRDIEEAKKIVGKTIQLEFKEQKTSIDPNEAEAIRLLAEDFLARVTTESERFEEIFSDFEDKPKITFQKDEAIEIEGEIVDEGWQWESELSKNFQSAMELQPGEIYQSLIPPDGEYFVDSSGGLKQKEGFYIAQLLAKEEEVEKINETAEERKASHILINFVGAEMAADTITRSREEAEAFANEILEQALALQNSGIVEVSVGEEVEKSAEVSEGSESEEGDEIESAEKTEESEEIKPPQNFAELAKKYSDGPTASGGGDLGFFTIEKMVPEFAGAVFNSSDFGVIPEVVETQFGFHIIEYSDKKEATSETTSETRVKFARAFFSTAPDGWQATGLTGQHFRRADVGSDPTTMQPIVNIYFTKVAVADSGVNWWILVWYLAAIASGIALFSSLVGIFLSEGQTKNLKRDRLLALVSALILVSAIYGIVVSQLADDSEINENSDSSISALDGEISETDSTGVDLFAEITKRNLHKPIAIFLDGLPIIDTNGDGMISESDPAYAPVVQSEIVNGQAVISGLKSYEEANQLVQNLNTGAIPAPVKLAGQFTVGATLGAEALTTSLRAGIYGLLAVAIFMILFYRLPGIIASLALAIYGALLIFAIQIFGVVLTLAGVAGVILSIGMAVDANILIFERMKEELKLGKSLARSVEDGFARAWTSIRDSNVSSLITCAILFWFGSSIIQGFALTLAVGILLSMFTAITVSRNFLRIAVNFFKNEKFYGIKKS